MNYVNSELTEYAFSEFTKIEERDKDRILYRVNPEYGEGVQIIYRIIDGMYLIYTDQFYHNNVRSDPDIYQNIVMMYQLISGEVRINLKNHKTLVVKKNDIVNFAGNAEFNDSYSNGSRIESIAIFCYYEKLWESLEALNIVSSELKEYYSEMKNTKDILIYTGDVQFMALIKEIKDIIKSDNRLLIKTKSLELLYRGITNYSRFRKGAKHIYDSSYIDGIFTVKSMIDENPQISYSISELAEKCNISSTYFKKIFKECFDIQPHRYIIIKRLEKSKDLLRESTMKIADIAIEMNFASSSKFSKAFNNEYGFLPSEYRKNCRHEGNTIKNTSQTCV